jgi:YfiH family protein
MGGFERRTLWEGAHAVVSSTLEEDGFLAAFFERTGGTSRAPFDSMNVSYGVGDDSQAVDSNRKRAAEAFDIDGFAVPGLVHGTTILPVGSVRARDGFDGPATLLGNADGLHTRRAALPLGAFSADCIIAVMADPVARRVALIHAGWRGMAAGILQKAAALFAERGEVRVAIGPTIGPCHYWVGDDVALAVEAGSPGGAVTARREGRLYLDLVGTARAGLAEIGMRRVEDTGLCTVCRSDRLFSFRGEGTTGRHLALAMRMG